MAGLIQVTRETAAGTRALLKYFMEFYGAYPMKHRAKAIRMFELWNRKLKEKRRPPAAFRGAQEQKAFRKELREAIADYMYSEGCSCCQDTESHDEHTARIARLLNVRMYPDKSGYDFSRYRTGQKKKIKVHG